jgi:DNA-binding MarR family transcriptional regulator
MRRMEPLFDIVPIRNRPPRGRRLPLRRGPGWYDPWPPPDRDPNDVALVTARLLATAGRTETRLRRVARAHGVDWRVCRFLLLFAERKAPLRVVDVAENMGISHPTAGRLVTRALEAGLVDLIDLSVIDGREVSVTLTVAGRDATNRCLDVLRDHAGALTTQLEPPHRGWSGAYGVRWYLRNAGPMDEGWVRYEPP